MQKVVDLAREIFCSFWHSSSTKLSQPVLIKTPGTYNNALACLHVKIVHLKSKAEVW